MRNWNRRREKARIEARRETEIDKRGDRKNRRRKNLDKHSACLLSLLFDSEDGGSMMLRNVSELPPFQYDLFRKNYCIRQ
jgi:hypothetical protein